MSGAKVKSALRRFLTVVVEATRTRSLRIISRISFFLKREFEVDSNNMIIHHTINVYRMLQGYIPIIYLV